MCLTCVAVALAHGDDGDAGAADELAEHVPVLAFGPDITPVPLGTRLTFSDIGQTLAQHLGIDRLPAGDSFWPDLAIGAIT